MNKDILIVSIFTLITVFAWIVFGVYHAAISTEITPTQEELAKPLNPQFDQNVLSKIRERGQSN